MRDITEEIDRYILTEATVPSQAGIRSAMSKGLEDAPEAFSVAMALWHYFDLNIVKNGGKIFKSQPSANLADELWFRIGAPVEKTERLTPEGFKKLKINFYGIMKKWSKVWTLDKSKKAWEFTG